MNHLDRKCILFFSKNALRGGLCPVILDFSDPCERAPAVEVGLFISTHIYIRFQRSLSMSLLTQTDFFSFYYSAFGSSLQPTGERINPTTNYNRVLISRRMIDLKLTLNHICLVKLRVPCFRYIYSRSI